MEQVTQDLHICNRQKCAYTYFLKGMPAGKKSACCTQASAVKLGKLRSALPHALHLTEQFSSDATAAANCARSAARASAASPGALSMSVLKLIWMLCCAASCHARASYLSSVHRLYAARYHQKQSACMRHLQGLCYCWCDVKDVSKGVHMRFLPRLALRAAGKVPDKSAKSDLCKGSA